MVVAICMCTLLACSANRRSADAPCKAPVLSVDAEGGSARKREPHPASDSGSTVPDHGTAFRPGAAEVTKPSLPSDTACSPTPSVPANDNSVSPARKLNVIAGVPLDVLPEQLRTLCPKTTVSKPRDGRYTVTCEGLNMGERFQNRLHVSYWEATNVIDAFTFRANLEDYQLVFRDLIRAYGAPGLVMLCRTEAGGWTCPVPWREMRGWPDVFKLGWFLEDAKIEAVVAPKQLVIAVSPERANTR